MRRISYYSEFEYRDIPQEYYYNTILSSFISKAFIEHNLTNKKFEHFEVELKLESSFELFGYRAFFNLSYKE